MSWTHRFLLFLALLSPGAAWALPNPPTPLAPSGVEDEAFDLLLREFKRQSSDGTRDERTKALQALLETGEDAVLGALAEQLGDLAGRVHDMQGDIQRQQLDVRHKRRLIADLERRVERDKGLEDSLIGQKRGLAELEQKLSRRKGSLDRTLPWYEELRAATAEQAPKVGSSARKKLEKSLWKTLDGDASFGKHFAAVDVLGALGSDGTAQRLQKFLVGLVKQRAGLQRKLPKQMREVRELEARMQEEAKRTGGRSSYGQQYDRLIQDASKTQEWIANLGRLCEAVLHAGGQSLAREPEASRAKSVPALFKAQKKGKDGVRRFTLRLLGVSGLPEVHGTMLGLLESEADPLVRATLIDALALGAQAAQAEEFETFLLEVALEDSTWLIKGRAARALAQLRSKPALPRLIERLAQEEGRTLDELEAALRALTGLDYHGNAALWQRWWDDNGEAYVVPSVAEVAKLQAEREEQLRGGTGFFGIESDSKRVLFVVDLSGSMVFSMIPRNNPEDDTSGGRRPDMPREGERSRLEEAKLALISAIGGMGRDGVFNLVFYASDVWSWKPTLQAMTDDNVAEALESVSELEAVGGTNIYGALLAALDMAGAQTTDTWDEPEVDTIFFLSDGRASIGITIAPDEILEFVRERNASAGITIHTIGLSGAQDAYLLGRLAEENGGIYVAR